MGFWSETTQRSLKRRRCDECGMPIDIGETYTRGVGINCQDDFGTWITHTDCLAATMEQRELGGLQPDDWWPVSEWVGEMPPDALAKLQEDWPGVYQRAVVDAQRARDEEATYRLWNKEP